MKYLVLYNGNEIISISEWVPGTAVVGPASHIVSIREDLEEKFPGIALPPEELVGEPD